MNNQAASPYSEPVGMVESNSLHDYWLYLRSFVRRGLNVASLVPSSRWTAQQMLHGIDFKRAEVVVELGAGTGAVTASLLKASRGYCRAIIVERDAAFCERLAERFPHAEIVAGDALELPEMLNRLEVSQIDHVLSTLPINWLPAEQRDHFFKSICRYLRVEGSFRQLTHMPWVQRSVFRKHFADVSCPLVLRNLPPAGCYVCREPLSVLEMAQCE